MKLTTKQQLFLFFLIAALAGLVGLGFWTQKWWRLREKIFSQPTQKYPHLKYLDEKVLAEADPPAAVAFNLPAVFNENVSIKKSLAVGGVKITPEAIVYRILAGPGISVSGGATPTITNTGVTSVQHRTGDLILEAGSGITLDSLKISNNDPGSAQNIFKNIKIGNTLLTASSNNDTLVFTAGEGITLNSTNKQIAIAASNTTYNAGGGLSLQGGTFAVNAPVCLETEKLSWNGTIFNCLTDIDTDTNNYPSTLTVSGESTKTITLSRQGLPDLTAQFTDLNTDTDTNNYPSALTVSGGSTKTITLSRQGLPDLTAQFTDLDTDTLYTAGTGLTLSQTVFKLGGNLDEDVALTGAGNLGLGTTNPLEKLDLAGNLKIFDPNTGRADIYTTIALNKTWTTAANFNTKGTNFTSGLFFPAGNELILKYSVANPALWGWRYRRAIGIQNNGSSLTNYQLLVTINTQTLIVAGKMQEGCQDLRFTDTDGETLLPYWIEDGCNTANTKIWVKIPSLPAGNKSLYLYYGNASASSEQTPEEVFSFFDDFNSFDSTKWANTGSYSVSNGKLTVSTGSVYTRNLVASQPNFISEAKVSWSTVSPFPCSFSVANAQSTQVSNGGKNKLTYLTLTYGEVKGYGADGTTASYNIVPAITQFTATANTNYILGHTVTANQFIYYKDRVQTGVYTGTWTAPFYLWFGYFMGAASGTTTISPISVDWVLIRQYTATPPTISSFGEEVENTYAAGKQTWTSETLDAGENNNFQPTLFTANWLLDGSDNLPPEFQLLGSNTGSFTGEETAFLLENLVSGQGKELFNIITRGFRYWKVKVTLDTGNNLSDSPRVFDFSLKEYRPSITLSAFQKVGIGTVSPVAKLEVADSQTTLALRTETNFITFLNSAGNTVGQIISNGSGGVTYSTSGSDFAEYFRKAAEEETFEPGEVVCLNTLGLVTKCDSVNTQMIGVVSGHAGFAGNGNYANDPKYVLVGLLGQLEVKVSTESGEINPGDTLTSSTTPGVAIKAEKNGQILGRALEAFTASESGKIKAFVHVSYEQVLADALTSSIKATPLSSSSSDIQVEGNLIVSGKTTLADTSITGNLTAGLVIVNGLEGSISSLGKNLKLQNGTVMIDLQGNITAEGEITAKKINIQGEIVSASLGESILKAGASQIMIKTSAVTEKSQIFITPQTKTDLPLAVTQKTPGVSFTVETETPATKDIKFSWWIIN